MNNKRTQYTTTFCFIGIIFALSICNIFSKKVDFSANENRALEKAPTVSTSTIFSGQFDDSFETYFADHFIARDGWIQLKAFTKQMTGSIENNTVYFSKDNRLIQQFMNYDVSTINNNLSYIAQFCKQNDIQANILLVPTASYAEENTLPNGAYNINEKQLIQTIYAQLQDENVIDICDALKAEEDTFYKTDHHWNENGAYIAYEAICKSVLNKQPNTFTYESIADDFKGTMYSKSGAFWYPGDTVSKIIPSIPFTTRVTYEDGSTSDSLFVEENLKEKDKYTYYVDGNHAYVDIQTNVKNKKKAVIVKDSFTHILLPFLASEYSELQVVDLRYYKQSVSALLDKNTDFYMIYNIETFVSDNNLAVLR